MSNDKFKPLKRIPQYINLHAHTWNSLQDGVGSPKDHYLETIEKGHAGCCATDHGSFLSAFELYEVKSKAMGDKKISAALKARNLDSHPIVAGAELYLYDDRPKRAIHSLVEEGKYKEILTLIKKLSSNSKYTSLYESGIELKLDVMSDSIGSKKTDKIGDKIITKLEALEAGENPDEKLVELIKEFSHKTGQCGSYKYNHITLLAKDSKGHSNLSYLTSIAGLPGNMYLRPRISLTDLFANKEGLIATTGCFLGMIPQAIHRNTGEERELMELFKNEFQDDFYVEIHLSDIRWEWDGKNRSWYSKETNPQEKVNMRLLELVREFGLMDRTYVTQDSHMPKKEDKLQQDIMILSDKNNKNGWHFHDAYPVMTVEEMWEMCQKNCHYLDEETFIKMCENSLQVIEKCKNYKIDKSIKLPEFVPGERPLGMDFYIEKEAKSFYPEGLHPLSTDFILNEIQQSYINNSKFQSTIQAQESEEQKLLNKKVILEKIQKYESTLDSLLTDFPREFYTQKVLRASKKSPVMRTVLRILLEKNKINFFDKQYRDACFREISILQMNGYYPLMPYFTMVEEISDVIVKNMEIKGPGRGSAAGSLFNYAFDITDVNPVKRSLSFERFLSRERIGFFVCEPVKNGLKDYLFGLKIFTDEYPVEWLELQNEFLDPILEKSSKEDGFDLNEFKTSFEYIYLIHNPEIISYLKNLVDSGEKFDSNLNNSTVTWRLGITTAPSGKITEVKGSMPDIDYDSSCRELIIDHFIRTRGVENVVLVGSYGTLGVKSAIKEIMKIKLAPNGHPYSQDDENAICRVYDKLKFSEEEAAKGGEWLFNTAKEKSPEFGDFFIQNPDLSDSIIEILGNKKSWGVHAAGVIISDTSLIRQMPCHWDNDKKRFVSQLDKKYVENFGWNKLDVLGLSTCEEIRDTFKRIKEKFGVDLFSKMEEIVDKEEPEVLMMAKKDTLGYFQIQTSEPTGHFKAQKADPLFTDLPIVMSAYRPGPMGTGIHKEILKAQNGETEITYDFPQLEPYLKKTYGQIIYQEQIMIICQVIGGRTAHEADDIRRAMGKKNAALLEPYEKLFMDYAVYTLNLDPVKCKELWVKMAKFAEYGFNESHAVAYAYLTYIQMYLSNYYKAHWIASVISLAKQKDGAKDKEIFKSFFRRYSSIIKAPSIKYSSMDYEVVNGMIITPLFAISGINKERSQTICSSGPYETFEEFISKCSGVVDKKVVNMLTLSGALDDFLQDVSVAVFSSTTNRHFLNFILKYVVKDSLTEEEISYINKEMNLFNLGVVDEIPSDIFEIDPIQKAWNKYNFRKFLVSYYSLCLSTVSFNDKFKVAMKDDLESISRDIILNQDEKTIKKYEDQYLNILTKEKDERELADPSLIKTPPKTKRTKASSDEVLVRKTKYVKFNNYDDVIPVLLSRGVDVSKGYREDIEKVLKFVDLSKGKMILEELSVLKVATFNSEETTKEAVVYAQEKVLRADKIYKTEELFDIAESNKNILSPIYDEMHQCRINGNRTGDMIDNAKTAYLLVILRTMLGKYETKPLVSETLTSKQGNSRSRDSVATAIALLLKPDDYSDLWKTNVFLKVNSMLDKQTYQLFMKLCGGKPQSPLIEVNNTLEIPVNVTCLIKALIGRYIIFNGKPGFELLKSLGVDDSLIANALEAIKEFNIRPENIENFRSRLKMIDFGVDVEEVSNALKSIDTSDVHGIQNFNYMESEVYVVGNVFRPEEKKKFKKERYIAWKNKTENTMKFKLVNDYGEFDVNVYDSDSYKAFVNSKVQTLDDAIIDYHPIILRVSMKYNLSRNTVELILGKGNGDIFYPLIHFI